MSEPPAQLKIYHITYVDNLASIIADGSLCSDSVRINTGKDNTAIGMSEIKDARLRRLVPCHAGTTVGDYVPFYFCPLGDALRDIVP